jgi:hypothetical protein
MYSESRLEVLPRLRHSILLEAPETVSCLLREFLLETERSTRSIKRSASDHGVFIRPIAWRLIRGGRP